MCFEILSIFRNFVVFVRGRSYDVAGPDRWAGLPRSDDFYPTFIWNLLPQFNQFKPSRRTNVFILLNPQSGYL